MTDTPKHPTHVTALAELAANAPDAAAARLKAHIEAHGPETWSLALLSRAEHEFGDGEAAFATANDALARFGDEVAEVQVALARVQTANDLPHAATHAMKALALAPEDFDVLLVCGRIAAEGGYADDANAYFDQAAGRVETGSAHAGGAETAGMTRVWQGRAVLHQLLGRAAESVAAVDEALALSPDNGALHRLRTVAHIYKDAADPHLMRMAALAETTDLAPFNRMDLDFALGKAWDDVDDVDQAFFHYARGNKVRRAHLTYDRAARRAYAQQIKRVFTADFLAKRHAAPAYPMTAAPAFPVVEAASQVTPVFVVGMPRSGTTLTEHILARHSRVTGLGELNFLHRMALDKTVEMTGEAFPGSVAQFPQSHFTAMGQGYLNNVARLTPATDVMVDKMPDNYAYVGLIARALPNAKIIHCTRNPMASGLSMFKAPLANTQLAYTFDLDDLGAELKVYEEIMAHWQAVLPGLICDVAYEDLVRDPEPQIRRMLDHLGLAWEDACLTDTPVAGTGTVVRTASVMQVREKIHTHSVDRWKAYETHLTPLKNALETD